MASPEEGYDCDFVSEVPDDLICSICHLTVKEPVQLGGCGHGMCKACFQQLKEYSEKSNVKLLCPMDREVIDINTVFSDKSAQRRVLNLTVRCCNKSTGCRWEGPLRQLKDHEGKCIKIGENGGGGDYLIASMLTQMEQFEDLLTKKNKEIDEYKQRVETLNATIQHLSIRLEACENDIGSEREKNAELEAKLVRTLSQKWWVLFSEMEQSMQFNEPFYTPWTPYCFQMSALMENNMLEIYLYRYRGKNDKPNGKISMNLPGYSFEIYIIGANGRKVGHETPFDSNFFNIDDGQKRSLGLGWNEFFETTDWDPWLINKHLHIFCRIKANC